MEFLPLELTVISAKDIKDVNLFGKMDVYVVVTLAGDSRTKQRTPIDKDGGTNPNWNFQMTFNIDEAAALRNGVVLVFQLRCDRSIGGDKDIGEVHVPVKELLDNAGEGKTAQSISYQVRTSSGKPKGQLNFSYKFGEKITPPAPIVTKGNEPVTAYPAVGGVAGTSVAYPPPGSSGGYPPSGYPLSPHGGYPYPPPPVAGYGYPPQGAYQHPPPGYGYPPAPGYGYPPMQQQQSKKKNKFGMGLGAGLLGGALGGLLIGDMVSDAAYDDGFADAGGFDF
ncbi:protein SRC2-like [Macadamia integrifolia]|uniref:protein SRC2-like n=1 Tax=Macadamia integrifolia TaxID=60698 RepID=UPI001C4FB699|nr:protein SRC2-like [Macadamia integrifolia]